MANPDKLATIGAGVVSKGEGIGLVRRGKQGTIENFTSPALYSGPSPQDYNSLEEYEAANGFADPDVSKYFFIKNITDSVAAQDQIKAERQERESQAAVRDNELGTFTGQAKQLGASALSGTSRYVGYAAALPDALKGAIAQFTVSDEQTEIFAKERQFNSDSEYLDQLEASIQTGLQAGEISAESAEQQLAQAKELRGQLQPLTEEESNLLDSTARINIQTAIESLGNAQDINEAFQTSSVSRLVNPLNREQLQEDFAESYANNAEHFENARKARAEKDTAGSVVNTIKGISGLVKDGVGDLIKNPAATFEFIAENLPQLAVGAYSTTLMGALNMSYSVDIYTSAIDDYRENNNGNLPTRTQAAEMLAFSLTAAAAEQVGDLAILGKLPGVSKAVEGTIGRVTGSALNNAGTRLVAGTAATAATEGATEVYQTAVEENFSRLNRDFDGEALFQAGILGAAAGGILGGTTRGLNEASRAARDKLARDAVRVKEQAEKDEQLRANLETGDVSDLLDPESENHAPHVAAGLMAQRARDQELTEEERQEATAQVDEIFKAEQQKYAELFNEVNEGTDVEQAKIDETAEQGKILKNIRDVRRQLQADTAPSQEQIEEKVQAAIVDEATPESIEAADEVITLMMQDPSQFSEGGVQQLVQSNSFTPEQKAYLEAFGETEAQLAQSGLKEGETPTPRSVTVDVLEGREGFKGIREYREDFGTAVNDQQEAAAQKQVENAERFLVLHKEKEAIFRRAAEVRTRDNVPVFAYKDVEGNWTYSKTKPPGFQSDKESGFQFGTSAKQVAASDRVNARISFENTVLGALASELRTAQQIAFNSQEVSNEDSAPAPEVETESSQEAAPEQEAESTLTEQTAEPATETVTESVQEETQDEEVQQAEGQTEQVTEPTQGELDFEEAAPETDELAEQIRKLAENIAEDTDINSTPARELDQIDFFNADLFEEYYEVRTDKDGSVSANPLIRFKDFLSKLITDTGEVREDVVLDSLNQDSLTEAEKGFIAVAAEMATELKDTITKSFLGATTNDRFRYEDYSKFMQERFDSNFSMAIAVAATSWIAQNSGGTGLATEAAMKAILGRDASDDTEINSADWAEYGRIGNHSSLVAQDLGRAIRQALGIFPKKGIPEGEIEKLEAALGGHAIAVLAQANIVKVTRKKNPNISESALDGNYALKGTSSYVAIARDKNRELIPINQQIFDASKDSKNILSKLFSFESGARPAETSKGSFNQLRTKVGMLVSKYQARVAKKVADRAWVIREDTKKFRNVVSRETVEKIIGVVSTEGKHPANVDSIEAKNLGLTREIDNLEEHENNNDGEFFLPPDIWQHQRAGLVSNLINPQQHHLHRHNMSLADWETEIDPNNPKSTRIFKLAVAQALGIKVDKKRHDAALEELQLGIEGEYAPLIAAMQRIMEVGNGETAEQADQDLIADFASSNDGFIAVDGLIGLAQLQQGVPFKSQMMFEIDGVTNGPALTHIFLGAANFAMGKMFGMYQAGEEVSYAEWREKPGNKDLYVTSIEKISDAISKNARLATLRSRMGSLISLGATDRDTMKTPLQAMVFGSGLGKAVRSIGNGIVGKYYAELESIVANSELSPKEKLAEARYTINRLNLMLPKRFQVPLPKSPDSILSESTGLSRNQIEELEKKFESTFGVEIKEVISGNFGEFIARRDNLNEMGRAIFQRYSTAYEHFYDKRVNELIAQNRMPVDSDGKPLRGLTPKDIDDINAKVGKMFPSVHTAMSKISDDLKSGLRVGKESRKANNPTRVFNQNLKFGIEYSVAHKASSSVRSRLNITTSTGELVDPGVATVILLTHAADSAIATATYDEFSSLNIHDAIGFGLADTEAGAKAFNKNTFNVLASYSLPLEITAALARSFQEAENFKENDPDLYEKLSALSLPNKKVGERVIPGAEINEEFMKAGTYAALSMEWRKLQFLEGLSVVDQYAFEGGGYEVTDSDRTRLAQMKKNIEKRAKNLKTMESKVGQILGNPITAFGEPATRVRAPQPEDTPWGVIGEAAIDSDIDVVNIFKGKNAQTASAVIDPLSAVIRSRSSGSVGKFQRGLLNKLKKAVGDTPVYFVTKENFKEFDIDPEFANSRAIFKSDGSGIYIKGPDFQTSAVTVETLVHELTHAGTVNMMQRFKGKKEADISKADLPAFRAVQEIEELYQAAIEQVKDKQGNIPSEYAPALANSYEMVAWGMSNLKFQQQVLAKITLEPKEGDTISTIKNGLKRFIDTLTNLFFGKGNKPSDRNGMGVLIGTTATLLEANWKRPTQAQQDQTFAMMDPDPRGFTSEEVFDGLQNPNQVLPGDYLAHLKNMISAIADVAYGGGRVYRSEAMRSTPSTVDDIYLDSLQKGKIPFTAKVSSKIRMHNQEAFAAEAIETTLRTIMEGNARDTFTARKELSNLFDRAKIALGDRAKTGEFKEIFTVTKRANGEGSDYLTEFAAAALTHAPLYNALKEVPYDLDTESYSDRNLAEKIKLFFHRLMNAFSRLQNGLHKGESVPAALYTLSKRIAAIETRKQSRILKAKDTAENWLEDKTKAITDETSARIAKALGADVIRNNRLKVVRGAGAIGKAALGGYADTFMDGLKQIRDSKEKAQLGFIGSIANEIRSGREDLEWAIDLITQRTQHDRTQNKIIQTTSEMVRNVFIGDLEKTELKALTILLRSDLTKLQKDYGVNGIIDFIADPNKLQAEINKLDATLTGPNGDYYSSAAKDLGLAMSTGEIASDMVMLNAHNIASMHGTGQSVSSSDVAAFTKILDPLISMHALKYANKAQKETLLEVARREAENTSGSGIKFILDMHRVMQEDALNELFNGSPAQIIKGYTKEITDPHVSIKTATEAEAVDLERAGYTQISGELAEDPSSTNAEARSLWKSRDGGLSETITGAIEIFGNSAKGTELHSGLTNSRGGANPHNARIHQNVMKRKSRAIASMQKRGRNYDPKQAVSRNKGKNFMVPVLDDRGNIANWRYMMKHSTRDDHMLRINNVDKILGGMAGNAYRKTAVPVMNNNAIDAIRSDYDKNFATKQNSFVDFNPKNADPRIAEQYRLLPAETKKHIRKVWGRDGMWVSNEAYNILFGYRKYSLRDAFEATPEARNYAEKILVYILKDIPRPGGNGLLGEQAAIKIARAENVWQAAVKAIKDIWVIKNVFTLLGNEMSNFFALWLSGVPATRIIKDKIVATNATLRYQAESKEMDMLQSQLRYGYISQGAAQQEAQQRITEIEESLRTNPMRDLIDAGMFQTLVEDIAQEDDPYSFKSRLDRWVDEKFAWSPQNPRLQQTIKQGKKLGSHAFLLHNTGGYKFLNQLTIMSDFTSRYSLYKHDTTKSTNPLAKDEALRKARTTFVNYDVPTHHGLQYMNDTGIIWFSKYFLRIQAVIVNLVKDNPFRAMQMLALNNWIYDFQDILESSVFAGKFLNVGAGALELPGAIDEIAPINALTTVF